MSYFSDGLSAALQIERFNLQLKNQFEKNSVGCNVDVTIKSLMTGKGHIAFVHGMIILDLADRTFSRDSLVRYCDHIGLEQKAELAAETCFPDGENFEGYILRAIPKAEIAGKQGDTSNLDKIYRGFEVAGLIEHKRVGNGSELAFRLTEQGRLFVERLKREHGDEFQASEAAE